MEEKSVEAILANDEIETQMHRISRRSFIWAGVVAASGVAGWKWLTSREELGMTPWPFRKTLELNEAVSRKLFSEARLAPVFPKSDAGEPKPNGTEGLSPDFDADAWKLLVNGESNRLAELTLGELKSYPRTEIVTELKCIEGWSQVVHWGGVRFSDFVSRTVGFSSAAAKYVGMATPDDGYFVGLDMESARHPQTLLCYEMNGALLTPEHGAPLRLAIPVKYGIKNIKRIGTITFTNERPKDYWAEQGYDWYAGH